MDSVAFGDKKSTKLTWKKESEARLSGGKSFVTHKTKRQKPRRAVSDA
mgnify:CR=1 FL=1